MYQAAEHQVDDSAVGAVDRIFTDDLGWMFTRNEVREYGIDGHAQAVRDDGLVTGRLLATQVEGGASRFHRPAADGSGWAFWSDNARAVHVGVWLRLLRTLLDEVSMAASRVSPCSAASATPPPRPPRSPELLADKVADTEIRAARRKREMRRR